MCNSPTYVQVTLIILIVVVVVVVNGKYLTPTKDRMISLLLDLDLYHL
jgi:hypothetical protein